MFDVLLAQTASVAVEAAYKALLQLSRQYYPPRTPTTKRQDMALHESETDLASKLAGKLLNEIEKTEQKKINQLTRAKIESYMRTLSQMARKQAISEFSDLDVERKFEVLRDIEKVRL